MTVRKGTISIRISKRDMKKLGRNQRDRIFYHDIETLYGVSGLTVNNIDINTMVNDLQRDLGFDKNVFNDVRYEALTHQYYVIVRPRKAFDDPEALRRLD